MHAVGTILDGPSRAHAVGQVLEDGDGGLPVDASVGDGDALLQGAEAARRGHLLVAFVDIGLDHDAHNTVLALAQLVRDGLGDERLVLVVLLRVACCPLLSVPSSFVYPT